jgi:hypothetical protein
VKDNNKLNELLSKTQVNLGLLFNQCFNEAFLSSTIKKIPSTIHIPTWAFYVGECARQ